MNPTGTTTTCITRPGRAGQNPAAATAKIDTAAVTPSGVYQRRSKTYGNFLRDPVAVGTDLPAVDAKRTEQLSLAAQMRPCTLSRRKPQEVSERR